MITQSSVVVGHSLLEIDHIFICVDAEPDPRTFEQLGLVCPEQCVRRFEQGIASRLVFFNNIYLELVWVENPEQAEMYAMRSGLDYVARSQWKATTYCPFGIALRQAITDVSRDACCSRMASETWGQASDSMGGLVRLASANLVAQWEPFCYVIPSAVALTTLFSNAQTTQGQVTSHALGIQRLTHAKVCMAYPGTLTAPVSMLQANDILELEQGWPFNLVLTFDHHRQKQSISLHALDIPLTLQY